MEIPFNSQKILTAFGYFFWINISAILLLNWIAYVEIGFLPKVQEDFPLGFLDWNEKYNWFNAFLAEVILFYTWITGFALSFIISPAYIGNLVLLRISQEYKEVKKSILSFSLYGFILFYLLNYQWLIENLLYDWTSISLEIHDWTWWFID